MIRELVTTSEHTAQPTRVLLKSRPTPARAGKYFNRIIAFHSVPAVLSSAAASEFLAIDFETKGGDISDGIAIQGIGLAWDTGNCYLPWTDFFDATKRQVIALLLNHKGLLAHNVPFDGGVAKAVWGKHLNWHACTYALTMFLSNEGWAGQKWGLKDLMTDILQWEDSNEHELDYWLVMNGWYKGNKLKDPTPEELHTRAIEGRLKPDKGEMWRAPSNILGKYCILDAEACYLLYIEHLLPVHKRFPEFQSFFHKEWMGHVRMHIDQKMHGILVDRDGLLLRKAVLEDEINGLTSKVLAHPDLQGGIKAIEKGMLDELAAKEPERFLKPKVRPPEPSRLTKSGKESRVWLNWIANEHKYKENVTSKNWLNWHTKYVTAKDGSDPDYRFNLQSGLQLAELFYQHRGYLVRVVTEKGGPATGIKALKHFGEPGALLIERSYHEKELGYIQDYIERTERRNTIHPSFRMPGTKTGRLSSNSPNLQQLPKSKAVMSLWQARPGHVFVDIDFAALESMVAGEMSGDPNLLELYGPGRPENDIHLFVAAQTPGLREAVLATGYTPAFPKPGTVAKAKKECKKERNLTKTVVYACIAEGTLIRTRDRGLVPIEQITQRDQVWDGFRWVGNDGAVFRGIRSLEDSFHGTQMTSDHLILATDGWYERKVFQGADSPQPVRSRIPRVSWSDFWSLVRSLFRHSA